MSLSIVGCDVGGTFTDLILYDEASRKITCSKVPSTPHNQAEGVIAALDQAGVDPKDIRLFIHGTTVTTNAVLERKLSRCGLITTRGFRDIIELGRRTRRHAYGLTGGFEPVIPRELRLEVSERMSAEGEVICPLDEDGLVVELQNLIDAGVESVVIHFLHSYANPAHEKRAAEVARSIWPNKYVTAGHEIVSEFREYERGVTAAVNASVQPVFDRYIDSLAKELKHRGFSRDLLVMQGNGGVASSTIVTNMPVQTVMSGPASGVIAAGYTAQHAGIGNVITYDMGGTSTDVALIENGVPYVSSELEIEYAMPLRVPMVDVHTVGAGGGSIAWVDDDGLLQIGPESAGARPGPICFGRGGKRVTITDANLLLGRLNPDGLLAVSSGVDVKELERYFDEQLGSALGLSPAEVAGAILRVANDKMAGAIRLVSLSRGHDPRDFCLLAFGGAGPLHASALARELGIPRVLIPSRPGLTNALGCLVADLRHDFVRTLNEPLSALDAQAVHAILQEHVKRGSDLIQKESHESAEISVQHRADMQFQGQSHVVPVNLPSADVSIEQLADLFAKAYWLRFRVELSELRPVLVNLHTAVMGKRQPIPVDAFHPGKVRRGPGKSATRLVWFKGRWVDTLVLQRETLTSGQTIPGPAIIEQLDTTTVIEPGDHAVVDHDGNIIITVIQEA
jgi:N-methylhydantoinase A